MENPNKIEIEGIKTIHKLCKFGADHKMEGCSFAEIVERMFEVLEASQKQQTESVEEVAFKNGYFAIDFGQLMQWDHMALSAYNYCDCGCAGYAQQLREEICSYTSVIPTEKTETTPLSTQCGCDGECNCPF